jgi:hypothetical protein
VKLRFMFSSPGIECVGKEDVASGGFRRATP